METAGKLPNDVKFLHMVVSSTHEDIVRHAIGRFPSPKSGIDTPNEHGQTPLHLAALSGSAEAARVLLEESANPNMRDDAGHAPLHIAAHRDDAAMVKLLIRANADINLADGSGCTPLHIAAMRGSVGAAAALIEAGADGSLRNGRRNTPHDEARREKNGCALPVFERHAQATGETKALTWRDPFKMLKARRRG